MFWGSLASIGGLWFGGSGRINSTMRAACAPVDSDLRYLGAWNLKVMVKVLQGR